MATTTEKTKTSNDKSDEKKATADKPAGVGFTQPKGDIAGKMMSKEELLALHRAKAAQKDVVTSDVVGYWNSDGECPITGTPEEGVIALDSGIDKSKPSLLTKWKATVPTIVADQDGVEDVCKVGDLVGVWYKPGMRDIRTLGGVEVTMSRNPAKDKDTGKGNPMKAFEIRAAGMGRLLHITEDRRERSAGVPTIFDVKQEALAASSIPRNATPTTIYEEGTKLPF